MINKETAKKEVEKLVKKYELVLQEGRVGQYQEANTRKDFILPLFSALGWETTNIEEVDEETAVSRGRVDYSFKLSSVARFYLEAKALKIDLDKQEYAQQAIDYAYNKGVTWAVLTDFEKIKVFNAEWKAKTLTDSQFFELAYNEFLDKFDQLWLLSKEAISQGFLDKEAERWGKKDKKQPISKQILADLLKAREKLTRNILKYPRLNKISEEELDESVQRILDRLIFIRTCEDRNIEHNRLLSAVRLWQEKGENLWENLKKIYRDFDKGYNSKLFEKHLCENLTIDDEILAEIIQDLYQTPDGSRYDFSAISADVLGNIYEQYLGHILKKTPKSARLKETYQHRKEMGIYYTPTYIVDYIVKNTLGEILKKTKPKNVNKIKVLDPACGSGSFLIRAFDEFINYWQKNSPGEFGYFRKIEILKNNLYGVDLDKQAVEIIQMNLLLKTLYHRERLPMLGHIKQGNSLISGSEEELKKYFGDEWKSKHPFEWEDEFLEIFANGGFDVVIGNPPYIAYYSKQSKGLDPEEEKYYKDNYNFILDKNKKGRLGSIMFFIERAIKLCKNDGYIGLILDLSIFENAYKEIRRYILENVRIKNIISDISVFEEVASGQMILILQKGKNAKNKILFQKKFDDKGVFIEQNLWNKPEDDYKFEYVPPESKSILTKMKEKSSHLEDLIKIITGVAVYATTEGREFFILKTKIKNNCFPLLEGGKSVTHKYCVPIPFSYIRYDKESEKRFNDRFERKYLIEKGSHQRPFNLRDIEDFKGEKIFIRQADNKITATYCDNLLFCNFSIFCCLPYKHKKIEYSLKYILSILNSKLLTFYAIQKGIINVKLGKTPQIRSGQRGPEGIAQLPIRKIDFSNPAEKKIQDDLIKLVDQMLELNNQLQKFGDKLTDERHKIESEIQKTDKEIDELIYKLYGLTNEEIKIVEGK